MCMFFNKKGKNGKMTTCILTPAFYGEKNFRFWILLYFRLEYENLIKKHINTKIYFAFSIKNIQFMSKRKIHFFNFSIFYESVFLTLPTKNL